MQPRAAHARMPGSSARSLSPSSPSRSPSGIVTVNSTRRIRRQIASSVPRTVGRWFVASPQLELGSELEPLGAHEARRDRVAAGHLVSPSPGQPLPVSGFDRRHEPGAAQAGDVVRDAFAAVEQRLRRRLHRVVAERVAQRLDVGRLCRWRRSRAGGRGPARGSSRSGCSRPRAGGRAIISARPAMIRPRNASHRGASAAGS